MPLDGRLLPPSGALENRDKPHSMFDHERTERGLERHFERKLGCNSKSHLQRRSQNLHNHKSAYHRGKCRCSVFYHLMFELTKTTYFKWSRL